MKRSFTSWVSKAFGTISLDVLRRGYNLADDLASDSLDQQDLRRMQRASIKPEKRKVLYQVQCVMLFFRIHFLPTEALEARCNRPGRSQPCPGAARRNYVRACPR